MCIYTLPGLGPGKSLGLATTLPYKSYRAINSFIGTLDFLIIFNSIHRAVHNYVHTSTLLELNCQLPTLCEM